MELNEYITDNSSAYCTALTNNSLELLIEYRCKLQCLDKTLTVIYNELNKEKVVSQHEIHTLFQVQQHLILTSISNYLVGEGLSEEEADPKQIEADIMLTIRTILDETVKHRLN